MEILPLSPMRRAIADHMSRSVRAAPQVTTIFEIDFGRVTTHLQQQKASYQQQGVHLTYTAYLVAATAKALREVPVLNGRYTEQGIVLNRQVNVGVAVALDDGLIVPVIRDADERSLIGIARSLADLSERARQSRLTAEDVQGGTFTISNHGVGGSLLATPIINQPQSGILGAGAITRRAMVIERDGEEAIAIRPVGYLALTFDHRVCDGAVADRFMRVIKTAIEQFG
jgi:2-oxoglutarate dehydrogenase E2 component (dihydrolipoamide succinyltransferase)